MNFFKPMKTKRHQFRFSPHYQPLAEARPALHHHSFLSAPLSLSYLSRAPSCAEAKSPRLFNHSSLMPRRLLTDIARFFRRSNSNRTQKEL